MAGCDMQDRPLTDPAEQFERGIELFQERSYANAEALLTQAVRAFESQNIPGNAARALSYLVRINLVHGRYRAATRQLQQAIDLSKRANDFRSEAHLHTLYGDMYSEMGLAPEALSSYRSAANLYSAFNDLNAVADLNLRMGRASLQDGAPEQAFERFESARQFFGARDAVLAAQAASGIAEVYLQQQAYAEAQSTIAQALSSLGSSSDPALEATLRMQSGLAYNAMGNPNAALEQLRSAANSLRVRKTGKELETLVLFRIGNVYYGNGRFTDARGYYTEGAAIARSAGDRIGEQYSQLMVALCQEQLTNPEQRTRQVEQLAGTYLQVAEGFAASGHRTGEAFATVQAGRLYTLAGLLDRAQQLFQRAVETVERMNGEFVHPEFHTPYLSHLKLEREKQEWHGMLAETLLRSGKSDEALWYLERAASKRMFDRLRTVDVSLHHPQLQHDVKVLRERLHRLRLLEVERSRLQARATEAGTGAEINTLHGEIEAMRTDLLQGSARIAAQHPNYEALIQIGGIRSAELQSHIPRGTVVVSFLPARDRLHIFAISRTRMEVRQSPIGREALLSQTEEYKRLLHDPNVYAGAAGAASVPVMTRFETLTTQLYDHFFKPIGNLFDRNLLIVAPPEFENFPFHALERQDDAGNVNYLIEITSVDYLPTFGALRFKTVSPARMRDVVAAGNPTGRNWSIDYELRDIRSFYKEAVILIGLEASWDRLETERGDVLQLATEFNGSRAEGMLGSLSLSDGETVGEALRTPFEQLTELPAYPVVLLSNQQGQGVGFTAAHAMLLRIHGTSDVFLNAWFADRKAAKFFSEFFFTHLSNGLAPGDAYRQAILNLIRTKDVNHPRSWGKFFHYGVG
jgi:tetratricopeptide (TPR) repeat protein